MKKLFSVLLCLSLLLSLGVLTVLASEDMPEEAVPAVSGDLGESSGILPEAEAEPLPAEESLAPSLDSAPEVTSGTPTDVYDENGNLVTSGTIAGTQVTWSYEDGVLTIAGSGAMPDFDYNDGENHVPWYAWTEKIRKIVVAPGVTRVGAHTADLCLGLSEIDLPEGLTEIGSAAFSGCAGLTQVVLPSTLESIGSSAFAGCSHADSGLKYINFPDGLKSIGGSAFLHDPLSAAVLPSSLESIGDDAFSGTAIREVIIPGGVTLERQAFGGCHNLTSVVVEEGVTELPQLCFYGCHSLTDLQLPSTLETVGSQAVFMTALSSLTLPSDDEYEFAGWIDEDGNFYTGEEVMQNSGYIGTLYSSWLYAWSEGRFTDVAETAWYHDAVQFCYQTGLMNGMSETLFAPTGTATRGQVVTVLWRLAGEPVMEDEGWYRAFSDVPDGAYYSDAVAWAAAFEITTGYTDGTFRPKNAVTRQEFLTFLYRFTESWLGEQPPACDREPLEEFIDAADVASWSEQAECWSVNAGLQTGAANSDGTLSLNPRQSIRRSELAAFLMRYCVILAL